MPVTDAILAVVDARGSLATAGLFAVVIASHSYSSVLTFRFNNGRMDTWSSIYTV